MDNIIKKLYPSARYYPSSQANIASITSSRIFGDINTKSSNIDAISYGKIEIPVGEEILSVSDIGVTNLKTTSAFTSIYQWFIKPIFGTRIESSIYSFRGMFGQIKVNKHFKGYVLLLPDHLEGKLGYIANIIQGYKTKYGNNCIHLEDPNFENYFVVYTDDEIEARMVLTPALMQRLTRLRQAFNRDLIFSFNEDTLYYASSTPDGFLKPGRKSLKNEKLLEQFYQEIDFCKTISKELDSKYHNTNNNLNKEGEVDNNINQSENIYSNDKKVLSRYRSATALLSIILLIILLVIFFITK